MGKHGDTLRSKAKPKRLREDLTGRRFNQLTVLALLTMKDPRGRMWECACTCGGRKAVATSDLKSGAIKSCGCALGRHAIDLTGRVFGNLTALCRATNLNGATRWKCICSCGNEAIVRSYSLRSGATVSCGCKKSEGKVKNVCSREIEDLIGKRFGLFTVLRRSEKLIAKDGTSSWVCRCDCGKIEEVSRTSLRRRKTKGCGCTAKKRGRKPGKGPEDLSGKRFGRLVAKDYVRTCKGRTGLQWRCVCDCGKVHCIDAGNLRNGNTRSCGCLRTPAKDAPLQNLFRSYAKGAATRGYDFGLTKGQFRKIIGQDCFYCGAPPIERKRKKKTYDGFAFNGIDRLNNSKGYSKDNCVAACKICNVMKTTHSPKFFLEHVKKIYKNKFQKKSKPKTIDKIPNQKIIKF